MLLSSCITVAFPLPYRCCNLRDVISHLIETSLSYILSVSSACGTKHLYHYGMVHQPQLRVLSSSGQYGEVRYCVGCVTMLTDPMRLEQRRTTRVVLQAKAQTLPRPSVCMSLGKGIRIQDSCLQSRDQHFEVNTEVISYLFSSHLIKSMLHFFRAALWRSLLLALAQIRLPMRYVLNLAASHSNITFPLGMFLQVGALLQYILQRSFRTVPIPYGTKSLVGSF